MRTLGSILGSASRTDILRVLYYQPEPVGLRYLARIAKVHPRSAELALKALLLEDFVVHKRTATRALYELNRDQPDAFVLKAVFDASAHTAMVLRNRSLDRRAYTILPFIAEASRMLEHARRRRHVA